MKTLVILPTYEERENVVSLIREIFRYCHDISIVVVDDNSSDLTWKVVQQEFEKDPRVFVIVNNEKNGIGAAYLTGFRYGLLNHFDFMITMDADFSHHPKEIPHFIKKSRDGDIIIGSRYMTGGGFKSWRLDRLFISKCANIFCRLFFGLKCSDYSSGYRGYKKGVIEYILSHGIISKGYSALEEILVVGYLKKINIIEIPIFFDNRKKGKSKLSFHEIISSGVKIFRFWLKVSSDRRRGDGLLYPKI